MSCIEVLLVRYDLRSPTAGIPSIFLLYRLVLLVSRYFTIVFSKVQEISYLYSEVFHAMSVVPWILV
jgi:hypothetical protein